MYYVKYIAFIGALILSGCAGMTDDLNPSGEDKTANGQQASATTVDNFEYTDIFSVISNLYTELDNADAVVFYFTMWCPICDSHIDHMKRHIVSKYPGVKFYLVDYVSGSIEQSLASAQASGLANSAMFTVISDYDHQLMDLFDGTMGTTIVIGKDKVIELNEDFKDGDKLDNTLEGLI